MNPVVGSDKMKLRNLIQAALVIVATTIAFCSGFWLGRSPIGKTYAFEGWTAGMPDDIQLTADDYGRARELADERLRALLRSPEYARQIPYLCMIEPYTNANRYSVQFWLGHPLRRLPESMQYEMLDFIRDQLWSFHSSEPNPWSRPNRRTGGDSQ